MLLGLLSPGRPPAVLAAACALLGAGLHFAQVGFLGVANPAVAAAVGILVSLLAAAAAVLWLRRWDARAVRSLPPGTGACLLTSPQPATDDPQ
ncbi:MAG: hypothetical protein D6729_02025 [Deltaproteobacteria bacterium]|nr:MAG: hypothetical protein D6729_02025 [Deltaproteobacteria bacterium]